MIRTQPRFSSYGEVRTADFCQPFLQEFLVLGETVVTHRFNIPSIIVASKGGTIRHDDKAVN